MRAEKEYSSRCGNHRTFIYAAASKKLMFASSRFHVSPLLLLLLFLLLLFKNVYAQMHARDGASADMNIYYSTCVVTVSFVHELPFVHKYHYEIKTRRLGVELVMEEKQFFIFRE